MSSKPDHPCAFLREVLKTKVPPELPECLEAEAELADAYAELLELRRFVMTVAAGDLSSTTSLKGYTAGALKTLQANLKHMTWQTQMIASGDFSQRLDFMGEFSTAFNAMTSRLEASLQTIRKSEKKLSRINAGLRLQVTRRKRAQADLAKSEAHYRNLTETMKDVVWILDTETLHFSYVSPSVQRLRGYTPEEIMTQPLDAALTPSEAARLKHIIRVNREKFLSGAMDSETYLTSEIEQLHKDGSSVWTEAIARYVKNNATGAVEIHGVTRDISERRALRLELERQATTDSLTGTANRRHFLGVAHQELERCKRHNAPLCLLMLDIDHFKAVNDTFGHAVGDRALQAVAKTCCKDLRSSDLIGRIGGEEFALLLVETDMDKACRAAKRLLIKVEATEIFTKKDQPVRVTISIGVAEHRPGIETLSELMLRADQALYKAKKSGRNRLEYLGYV